MLRPIVSTPSSTAPRFAASMIDGPPPEQTTNCRWPSSSRLAAAGEARQLRRDIVIMRLGLQPLGNGALLVVGRARDERIGHRRLRNPCRAVEDEGRADLRFVHEQLGLQELKLEADGPQVLTQEELGVLERQLVSGALGLRAGRHMASGFRVDLGVRENALGRYWVCHLLDRLAEQIDRPKRRPTPPQRATCSSRPGESRTSPRQGRRRGAASRSEARRLRG